VNAQRRQAVPGPVAMVGDEPLGVLLPQQGRVVATSRDVCLQESAEFRRRPPEIVERPTSAWAARGLK
jgi:hypothetical protein